jgi:ATP-dependent exoDNAse (exonuclease V) alpha subunit
VATYFLNVKSFGRSGGSSAVAAAAYRSGERIRDERTGRIYDHTGRQDVMHKEILLPARYADADMSWAATRASLWNAAEAAETRKNSRVAREYLIALPVELTAEQQVNVVRGFGRELSERYGFALDVAIHAPRDFAGSDPRNFHAHLLATTREVSREGLGRKTTLEIHEARRRELGLDPSINDLLFVRQRWAEVANEALASAHLDARIDHRTLEAQGISREPKLWIPRVAYEVERRGFSSPVADGMREQHRQRLEAHRGAALESRDAASKRMSVRDIQQQSVENWLRFKREAQQSEATRPDSRDRADEADRSRAGPDRDADLGP